MVTIVIPFAGPGGKTRLHESAEVRDALATAMFEDVLAACTPVGPTNVADQGGGQGAAVAAALAGVEGPVVVVNADVPCVVPADVRLLAETAPALVAAADGTTNALSLPSADLFEPLYGAGSAARFQRPVRRRVDGDPESRGRRRHDGRSRRASSFGSGRAPSSRSTRCNGARVNVVVLSGGVGGARFVRGVVAVAGAASTTVIGNVGDDVEVLGLHVSPDLDSILYALAGLADEERGWGRAGETWRALETVRELGGEGWFALGDLDLGLHLVRTQALRTGEPLSAVTARLAQALGVETRILPATDDRLRTWLDTPAGSFAVPGMVRRARAPRRGRRAALRGSRDRAARAGNARGACRSGSDPRRTEQPVRLDPPDPRGRRVARRARRTSRALRRGQPAHRRPRGERPRRPDAPPPRRRDVSRAT